MRVEVAGVGASEHGGTLEACHKEITLASSANSRGGSREVLLLFLSSLLLWQAPGVSRAAAQRYQ